MERVVTTRGGCIETTHPISSVVCRVNGDVVASTGAEITTTWRSAAKPFQLLASLEWLGRSSFSDGFMAIGAASHSAEPRHIRTVAALLDVLDVSESALRCGAHEPLEPGTHRLMVRKGEEPSSVHNNCSGKHAFMAGALAAQGYRGQDYRDVNHPFQAHVRQVIERYTGPLTHAPGTDGCGVPCWVLPLQQMAHAWAQLGAAIGDSEDRLGAIGRAMQARPELVSGKGRLDLAVSEASRGAVISKVGAAGLLCAAIPSAGIGVALKVHSGLAQARAVSAASLFSQLLPEQFDVRHPWFVEQAIVRNVVNAAVGQVFVEP